MAGEGRPKGEGSEAEEEARRMEAFALLAGGIAHDFNNLISLVIGYSDLLLSEDACPPAGKVYAQQINDAGRRAAALTRRLLTFGRRETMKLRPVALNELVEGLARMLRRVVGDGVRLELELDPSAPGINADPTLVEQVLINLAVNARDAMPGGGDLRIATRTAALAPEPGRPLPPGRYAVVEVADTGSGMAPAVMARLFEPFFTTKPRGKAAGLGLATARHLAREHGGWIEAASAPGRGSVFTVYFPLLPTEPAPAKPGPEPAAEKPAREPAVILLIEDEAPVRDLIGRILGRQGHRVVPAASADEALKAWELERDAIDLVLTDIVLPGGMSGRELATQFRRQKPRLGLLYMTGYVGDAADRDFVRRMPERLLHKPFSHGDLVEAVRAALEESRQA